VHENLSLAEAVLHRTPQLVDDFNAEAKDIIERQEEEINSNQPVDFALKLRLRVAV
jgi:hypothetical protein